MNCGQCEGIERLFDQRTASKELKRYQNKGLAGLGKASRLLIDALKSQGVRGMTLLDIGGGIGYIQHEMLGAGVSRVTSVDASRAYIEAAREEAGRLGLADRIVQHHGNFVDLAPTIDPVDIVTLDKVICCYHDMHALVGLSSAKARRLYGLVYPRDNSGTRVFMKISNFVHWLKGCPFRSFRHRTEAVDAILREGGWKRSFYRRTFVWQIIVYSR